MTQWQKQVRRERGREGGRVWRWSNLLLAFVISFGLNDAVAEAGKEGGREGGREGGKEDVHDG